MNIYYRIRRFDESDNPIEDTIPSWPAIISFTRVLDGKMEASEFISQFNLNASEQLELQQILGGVQTVMTAMIAEYVTEVGSSPAFAAKEIRTRFFGIIWMLIAGTELGVVPLDEFKATLGVS